MFAEQMTGVVSVVTGLIDSTDSPISPPRHGEPRLDLNLSESDKQTRSFSDIVKLVQDTRAGLLTCALDANSPNRWPFHLLEMLANNGWIEGAARDRFAATFESENPGL